MEKHSFKSNHWLHLPDKQADLKATIDCISPINKQIWKAFFSAIILTSAFDASIFKESINVKKQILIIALQYSTLF